MDRPRKDTWYLRRTGPRKGLELAITWFVSRETVHYNLVRLGEVAPGGPEATARVRYGRSRMSQAAVKTFSRAWEPVPPEKMRELAFALEQVQAAFAAEVLGGSV